MRNYGLCVNDDELKEMYIDKCMSVHKISKQIGEYDLRVKGRLVELGVYKKGLNGSAGRSFASEIDMEALRKMYLEECISITEIAEKLNLTWNIVRNRLIEMGIYNYSDYRRNYIETGVGEAELRHMYLNKHMSTATIGKELGVSSRTVERRLREYGIRKYRERAVKK